jgi:diguanylate cyclase (GGDEF)-like protein
MRHNAISSDEFEDLQRKVACAEACADPVNFDQMLNRVCALLNKWAQADLVTLILPPEEEGLEPMLHVFGQQPLLPIAERAVRDDCASLLASLDYADLPGEALRLRRGAELMPINGTIRDDYMYRFWWHEMKLDGETVGLVGLYGFVDWVLSPRVRRLLASLMPMLATAINNAAAIENLRMQSDRDEMTGLLNQRGVFDLLDRECNRSNVSNHDLAVLLCEIEDFEGHAGTGEGNAALQAFTELALTLNRGFDVVGRIATNEFVFILPEIDAETAQGLMNAITDGAAHISLAGEPLSAAIGYAQYDSGKTADILLQEADEALFEVRRRRALGAHVAG